MKKYLCLFFFGLICCFPVRGQVLINEYSAANYDTYQDNYGEYEDWLELYNPSANPMDIS